MSKHLSTECFRERKCILFVFVLSINLHDHCYYVYVHTHTHATIYTGYIHSEKNYKLDKVPSIEKVSAWDGKDAQPPVEEPLDMDWDK